MLLNYNLTPKQFISQFDIDQVGQNGTKWVHLFQAEKLYYKKLQLQAKFKQVLHSTDIRL